MRGPDGLIKIGHTRYPQERLCTVGAQAFVGLLRFEEAGEAMAEERALHRKLKDFRVHGEWFLPDEEVLRSVEHMKDSARDSEMVSISVKLPRQMVESLREMVESLREMARQQDRKPQAVAAQVVAAGLLAQEKSK